MKKKNGRAKQSKKTKKKHSSSSSVVVAAPALSRLAAHLRLLLDLRTVAPEEDTELLEALRIAARTPIHLSGS